METVSVTHARANLYTLVDAVIHGAPRCIKSKEGSVVVVSLADWESLQETLSLLSDKKLCDEIKDRMKTPLSDCVGALDW